MPTVYGTLADIGLEALTPFSPVIQFAPSEMAFGGDGRLFATKPVEVVPNSAGSFTIDLASTDDIVPARAHWLLSLGWRNPDGYMASAGYFAKDFAAWKVRVPAAGGQLADMIDAPPRTDAMWIGTTEPPSDDYAVWFDTSTTPVTIKEWSA